MLKGWSTHPAHAFETTAEYAIIKDFQTQRILFEKQINKRMYPASMTKIMTAYLAFEALKNGTIKLSDQLTVSVKAWRKGGSKMFLEAGSKVSIENILRGIIIQSGNDASIALAEHLAGSEEAFADMMNRKAKKLGMHNTNFTNSSGWPNDNHYTTAADLVKLAESMIQNFPEFYHLYSETSFTYNNIRQNNRNPLLYDSYLAVDGLKTGHTEASGYGLTASANKNQHRLTMVINGLNSTSERTQQSKALLQWAFNNFTLKRFFDTNAPIVEIPVWFGHKATVKAKALHMQLLTLSHDEFDQATLHLHYKTYPKAPIKKGDTLGIIKIKVPGMPSSDIKLIADETIERQAFITEILSKIALLVSH
ncbi:MAG: D-alanyl-D-alanine carboxypeptidase family protein [Pseudomonadota bacterium]